MAGKKKYRRPDGTTYEQYGGPKSRQDVVVEDEPAPAPSPSPSPSPTPGPGSQASMVSGGTMSKKKREHDVAVAAEEATEKAEAADKYAPWLTRKKKKNVGGLGDAAARARTGRVSAAEAGDAMADRKKEDE